METQTTTSIPEFDEKSLRQQIRERSRMSMKHPPSVKIFDDSIMMDLPDVEAIYYEITNLENGIKYIGSHKLVPFGNWLDSYYHSSENEEFYNLFWGLKKDLFEYKIVAAGIHQDMKNLENKIGTDNQVHTNPKYYNLAIPNKGFKSPARIELCEWTANLIRTNAFNRVNEKGEWILRPTLDIEGMIKHQARKYVDAKNTIKDIKQKVIENNSIDKTEPLTLWGESKELLLDGNRTFIACKGLKQAKAGFKVRQVPDWFIEEHKYTQLEVELIAEFLNPRDEVEKEPTDADTVYDTIIKNKRVYGIDFASEYNKKYLRAHHYHEKQISQMLPVAKKMYEVEEEKKEYGSTYIQWDDTENCQERINLEKKCESIESQSNGRTITIIGSAGNGKGLFVEVLDKMMVSPNFRHVIIYPYIKDKHIRDKWQGGQTVKMNKKGDLVTKTKSSARQNLCDRLDYVIGSMNIGLSEEYYKSYEVIDLDYLRPKQTDGNQSDIS
jgi:hypothetical protein